MFNNSSRKIDKIPTPSSLESFKKKFPTNIVHSEEILDNFLKLHTSSDESQETISSDCIYRASLSRLIIVKDLGLHCNAVYTYENEGFDVFYTSAKLNNFSGQQDEEILKTFRYLLIESSKKDRKEYWNNIWKYVRISTLKRIKSNSVTIKTASVKAKNDLKSELLNSFKLWEELINKLENFPDDFGLVKYRLSELDKSLRKVFLFLGKENKNSISNGRFSSTFYLTLYVQDYIRIFEDIENYYLEKKESNLKRIWTCIEKGSWEDISNSNSHAEMSIIGKIFNEKNHIYDSDIQEVFKDAQLRTKNPLVANLWSCFVCQVIINSLGKVFNEGEETLSLKDGSCYKNSQPLHFIKLEEKSNQPLALNVEKASKKADETLDQFEGKLAFKDVFSEVQDSFSKYFKVGAFGEELISCVEEVEKKIT